DPIAPAEPLFEELFQRLGRFRHGDGPVVMLDDIPATQDADRQIAVLGQRIGSKAAGIFDCFFPESADRARHHRDAVDVSECLPVEILTADVFDGLPAREEIHLVAYFDVAGYSANGTAIYPVAFAFFTKVLHHQAHRIGQQLGVRIDTDHIFR